MRGRAFGRARNERGGRGREVTSLRCARGAGGKNRKWARLEAAPPEVARACQAHGKLSICLHAAAISHGGQGTARPTSPIQPDKCECLDFTLYWTMRKTASNGQPQYSPCRPFHLHRMHNPIADPFTGRHPPLGGGRMLARSPGPEYGVCFGGSWPHDSLEQSQKTCNRIRGGPGFVRAVSVGRHDRKPVRAAATKRGPPKEAALLREPFQRIPAADAQKRVPPRGERTGGKLPGRYGTT